MSLWLCRIGYHHRDDLPMKRPVREGALALAASFLMIGCGDKQGQEGAEREAASAHGSSGRSRREPQARVPDPQEILAKVRKLSPADLKSLDSDLRLALRENPSAMLEQAGSLPPGPLRDALLARVAENFPPDRTRLLVEWADASEIGKDRSLLRRALAQEKTDMKPGEAASLLAKARSEEIRTLLLGYTAHESLELGYVTTGQARELASGFPMEIRQQYMKEFLAGLRSRDVSKAISEVLDHPGDYDGGDRQSCLAEAGVTSPGKTRALVLAAAERTGDSSLVVAFVEGYLQSDSMAAGEWVEADLTGETKDAAASSIVRFLLSHGDKEAAKAWRESIVSKDVRDTLPEF